jgi:hypothetical protein
MHLPQVFESTFLVFLSLIKISRRLNSELSLKFVGADMQLSFTNPYLCLFESEKTVPCNKHPTNRWQR